MGHIVNVNGYKPETQKVSEVINFKGPNCVRELRQFLAMLGFYSKFIENYSQEVVHLCGLLKKNVPFNWSSECEDAFQILKQQLENPSMLHYPDCAKPYLTNRCFGVCYQLCFIPRKK